MNTLEFLETDECPTPKSILLTVSSQYHLEDSLLTQRVIMDKVILSTNN